MATRRITPDQRATQEVRLTENLRLARKLAGLSQSGLAREAGVDSQQISKWERGVLKPSPNNLAILATALGRDLGWFYLDHETETDAA